MAGNGQAQDGSPGTLGPQPPRRDKRLYLVLMTICIGLFVLSWAVLDRYSVTAAVAVSVVALVIPPFAAIIANAASATDRKRPLSRTPLAHRPRTPCPSATPAAPPCPAATRRHPHPAAKLLESAMRDPGG